MTKGGDLSRIAAHEMHVKVLAIRVEFQPDTLTTTTGDGTFNSGFPQNMVVDPLPHNRSYFEDHLRFLANYFGEVSNGKMTLDDFAVFPVGADDAYTLPHQMWHYNYNSTQEDLNRRLGWLFRDAWEAAAADTAVHPENYDVFIVYHAGVGQDFQVGFDETPHDIPSALITLEDLRGALEDPDYPGIEVNGALVTRGLLLPESERQSEVDVEIALNGTAALLFANSIGLPALYNTENGTSGIGRFGLMDQGSGNFAGMIPARPCAWSRVFMGWEEAVTLHPEAVADTFYVNVSGYGNPADTTLHPIYRVDLDENEYYLIENRSDDPDSLGFTYVYDRQNRRLKIRKDYTIEVMDGGFGVIVRADNYDFGLPGEGILIWHIDQSVIEAKYAQNTINNDLAHRGVALVEADAAQDIGQQYGFLDVGYGVEYGWSRDFFFAGNEEFLAANPKYSSVVFYNESFPNTKTYGGASTGLRFDGFSPRDTVMSFRVENDWAQAGFPRKLAEASAQLSPSVLDFDHDGKTDRILTVTPGGAIQAFDGQGRALGGLFETHWEADLLGDSALVQDTLLARVDSIRFTPALDVTEDGFTAILPSVGGKIYLLEYDLGVDQLVVDSLNLEASVSCLPVIGGSDSRRIWAIGTSAGEFRAYDAENYVLFSSIPFPGEPVVGLCLQDTAQTAPFFLLTSEGGAAALDVLEEKVVWSSRLPLHPSFPPIAMYHPFYQRWDLAAVGNGGDVLLLHPEDGTFLAGFPVNIGMEITAPPSAADFDRDGRMEIILLGANRILGLSVNGTLTANWKTLVDADKPQAPLLSPPLLCDMTLNSNISQTGEIKVIFGWSDGSVDVAGNSGVASRDFPLATGNPVQSAPLLVQMDDDVKPELLALDAQGMLYCWHLAQPGVFEQMRIPWNGLQNGNRRSGLALDVVPAAPQDPSLLITSKVYPWPNPAGDVSHIRYKMGQSGTVTVRIFDQAGDLVEELHGTAEAGLEGEILWNLNRVDSGIYIGRVEAEANGKKEKAFIKIAVIK
jgi:M6 family metalloprotease-like protein